MEHQLFQVDAFTSKVFGGNPAAVIPLEQWLPDATLQAIALENNLPETAYFIPAAATESVDFHLRWFTPEVEMDLCGHATLAAAHVLMRHLGYEKKQVRFGSQSGSLAVERDGDRLVLDFPSRVPEPREVTPAFSEALGARPKELHLARDWLAVYGTEEEVRSLRPDFAKVSALGAFAVIVTAPGKNSDFVSRFFAPGAGVPEDPVTGSAHCTLIPYWSRRLGKKSLHALQVSKRGGELFCEDAGERVKIGGHAVTYLEGTIRI
ncbi:MAG TPA: PhzF family phenazine biosynthesis protein [Phycisphaerae bacterium]|nr:PhzF family phenazine biosynthesis protein [Phycisphaerae bacterium]